VESRESLEAVMTVEQNLDNWVAQIKEGVNRLDNNKTSANADSILLTASYMRADLLDLPPDHIRQDEFFAWIKYGENIADGFKEIEWPMSDEKYNILRSAEELKLMRALGERYGSQAEAVVQDVKKRTSTLVTIGLLAGLYFLMR
jgi:hypothetical protein